MGRPRKQFRGLPSVWSNPKHDESDRRAASFLAITEAAALVGKKDGLAESPYRSVSRNSIRRSFA
jgi:hypothetical protein